MSKSINDIITNDKNKVIEFSDAIKDMMNTRYILAEGKLIRVLQIIAVSSILQKVITDCLKDFRYTVEVANCKVLVGENYKIKLPENPRKIIALVFCILVDMDNKRIHMNEFLRAFYTNKDMNVSYLNFCNEIIEPFRHCVVDEVEKMLVPTIQAEVHEILPPVFDDINHFIKALDNYDLTKHEKDEYIFMCDEIAELIKKENTGGAKAIIIALRRSFSSEPELLKLLKVVEEKL